MGKEIRIPQGVYLVGRDIPVGIYVIKTTSNAYVRHHLKKDNYRHYSLRDDYKECRVDVNMGDSLELEGEFTIQRVTKFMIDFD